MLRRFSVYAALAVGLCLGVVLSYRPSADASRNSSGTYSLPAGNPVTTGTTITSTWANATLPDIASEITNSLDRTGRGSMSQPLKLASGTVAAPGLTFSADSDCGLYRIGANNVGVSVSGAKVLDVATTGLGVTGTLSASGVASLADGAVGTPGLNFTSDTNSGVYRIGADNVGVAVNGAKVLDVATTGLTVTGALTSTGALSATTGVFSSNVNVTGTVTASNTLKAWAVITNAAVTAGSGISAVGCSSSCADVTMSAPLTNPYAVTVTPIAIGGGTSGVMTEVTHTSTTVFRVCFYSATATPVDMCATNDKYSLIVMGT
jgi:hypothetical protein